MFFSIDGRPIHIHDGGELVTNLHTTYMGLSLKNPVVPSASPLTRDLGVIKAMEDAGAGAVVLYSLFEEQIGLEADELKHVLSRGAQSLADASSYFPSQLEYTRDPDAYVEHVRKAKEAVDIPIIASMNGISRGGWLEYSKKIAEAGADGLELNIYFIPTTARLFGMDIETLYLDIVKSVKRQVNIPIAVKLSPFFTALPNFADQLVDAGAEGLVLFNRFYQPDIDLDRREVLASLALSTPTDMRLPLRWIAILYGEIETSLALSGGVHSADDAMKALMAGADIANVCSVLLKEGVGKIGELVQGLAHRMEEKGFKSVEALKGSLSLQSYVEPWAFERASYLRLLQSYGR
jgi:dihydroorotate dehydrogenase (fumarate)